MAISRVEQLGLVTATEEEISVIESLTEAEFELLLRMRQRLEETADVQGHTMEGGGLVW